MKSPSHSTFLISKDFNSSFSSISTKICPHKNTKLGMDPALFILASAIFGWVCETVMRDGGMSCKSRFVRVGRMLTGRFLLNFYEICFFDFWNFFWKFRFYENSRFSSFCSCRDCLAFLLKTCFSCSRSCIFYVLPRRTQFISITYIQENRSCVGSAVSSEIEKVYF